jgi:hypothetical protein
MYFLDLIGNTSEKYRGSHLLYTSAFQGLSRRIRSGLLITAFGKAIRAVEGGMDLIFAASPSSVQFRHQPSEFFSSACNGTSRSNYFDSPL